MSVIYGYKNIKIDNLVFAQPIKLLNGLYNAKLRVPRVNNKEEFDDGLYVQIPKMKIVQVNVEGGRKFIELEFSDESKDFYNFLVNFDNTVLRYVYHNSMLWFNKTEKIPVDELEDKFKSAIRAAKVHGAPATIRLYILVDDTNKIDINIYNEQKETIDANTALKVGMECIGIISIKSLWISKNNFGYEINLEQLKVYTGNKSGKRIKEYMFNELSNSDEELDLDDPVEIEDYEGVTLKPENIKN